jgi:hypothetical protein
MNYSHFFRDISQGLDDIKQHKISYLIIYFMVDLIILKIMHNNNYANILRKIDKYIKECILALVS